MQLPAVDVDVVVAVHDLARRVDRTVLSALEGADLAGVVPGGHRVRVTVACHDLDAGAVRRRVEEALERAGEDDLASHVRYVEVRDGLRSPAGPFNAGLAAADGRYVSIIGSDDRYAPGALSAWIALADELGSAWLMARLETDTGEHIPTPRTRPGRSQDLDLVLDRLAYRTAPLGLLRRDTLVELGLLTSPPPASSGAPDPSAAGYGVHAASSRVPGGPLTPGLATGEDVELSLRLAASGERIDYAVDLPPYVIGTGADEDGAPGGPAEPALERTTHVRRPVVDELAAHARLLDLRWVRALPEAARRAIVVKTLRIHVLAAVRRRPSPLDWAPGEAAWVRELTRELLAMAPDAERALHRADRRLLEAVLTAPDIDALADASRARAGASRWDILLTPAPAANLDRESTVRQHLAETVGRARRALGRRHPVSSAGAATTPGVRSWEGPPPQVSGGGGTGGSGSGGSGSGGSGSGGRGTSGRGASGRGTSGRGTGGRPRVLVLSFSPVASDARVLKQVHHLSREADVVTCGYGPAPAGVTAHVRIPDEATNELDGRLITLHAYRAAYLAQSGVRWVRSSIAPSTADVILANDLDAVPLALLLRPVRGVHADLHEYFPRLHEEHEAWMRRIAPYQEWLSRRYLPRCDAVTTVSHRIAQEYAETFGVEVGVVTNASPYAELAPTPVTAPVRLVHSGACLRNRDIHVMVDAVAAAARGGADVTLDLYLTPNDPGYLAELRERATGTNGVVTVRAPVPYAELLPTLNGYDVGVHVLPPSSFNNANALPNKVFDYVQARLGLLVGPSPEMAMLVHRHGLGEVAAAFDATAVAAAVARLDQDAVTRFKQASHAAAAQLSDTEQSRLWVDSVARIAGRGVAR